MAIKLSEAVATPVGRFQDTLARHLPARSVRWVRAEQIHLTLRFLGDVEAGQLPALKERLATACAGMGPLRLTVEGLGCFPHARRPRVLWLGVGGDLEQLARLHARIRTATEGYGVPDEPEFHAHLTLGRVNAREADASRQVAGTIQGLPRGPEGGWTADRAVLVRSDLQPNGAVYRDLAEFPLSGPTT